MWFLWGVYGEYMVSNYQNGQYGGSMETVRRLYGKISLAIVWDFHGGNIVNQIARQLILL